MYKNHFILLALATFIAIVNPCEAQQHNHIHKHALALKSSSNARTSTSKSLPQTKTDYYYDSTSMTWIENGSTKYTYNNSGLITKEVNFNKEGDTTELRFYTFDSFGKVLENLRQSKDGSNAYKYNTSYDEKGNVASESEYTWQNDEWTLVGSWTYSYLYDERGRIIQESSDDYKDIYTYSDNSAHYNSDTYYELINGNWELSEKDSNITWGTFIDWDSPKGWISYEDWTNDEYIDYQYGKSGKSFLKMSGDTITYRDEQYIDGVLADSWQTKDIFIRNNAGDIIEEIYENSGGEGETPGKTKSVYSDYTASDITSVTSALSSSELQIQGIANHVRIEFLNASTEKADITVFNLLGEEIFKTEGVSTASEKYEFNPNPRENGIYLVKVGTTNTAYSAKVYLEK